MSIYDDHNVLGGSMKSDGTSKGWQDHKVESVKILTAVEAVALSNDITSEKNSKSIQKIADYIHAAAKRGERCTTVSSIDPPVKNYLENIGYTIKHYPGDYRESGYYSISW